LGIICYDRQNRKGFPPQEAGEVLVNRDREALSSGWYVCSDLPQTCWVLRFLWPTQEALGLPDGQLQTCEVCYVVLVPMISRERFEFLYALSDPAVDIELVLPKYQHWSMMGGDVRDGTFFLWQDVEDLAERELLKLTTLQNQERSWYWECSEYYGLFQISLENQSSDEIGFRYWADKLSLQLGSYCRDSLSQRFSELRPIIMEMMLLDNFRFRFDPKWRRPWGTDKEEVLQYARIAGRWKGSKSDWNRRPWRIRNLPSFTGCLIRTLTSRSMRKKAPSCAFRSISIGVNKQGVSWK
jgi:hypothetical protein